MLYSFVFGLKIPIVVALYGTKTTRPSGSSTPPLYAALPGAPAIVLYSFVVGLKIPIVVALCGTKTTRPSRSSTPDEYELYRCISTAFVVYTISS